MSQSSNCDTGVSNANAAPDEEAKKLEKTLRSYYKLCSEKENRKRIIKDVTFIGIVTNLLADTRPNVMKYLIEILLLLTDNKEDASLLSAIEGLKQAVGAAQEGPFSPNAVKQLMVISSRLQTVEKKKIITTNAGDHEQKRFFPKMNRQIVFEIEDLSEKLRSTIENMCLSRLGKRGLISVYCDVGKSRVVLRTTQSLDAKAISEVLFDCGCDFVTQLTKVNGIEEKFVMYASERERRTEAMSTVLPDYLEDNVGSFDPSSTLVTKEHAQQNGWFSSVTSYVRWW